MRGRKIFVLILVLFLIFIFYISTKEFKRLPTKPIYIEERTIKQFDWQNNLPKIKKLILEKFKDLPKDINPSIEKIFDLDGDNIDEALINLNYGGAATENYILARSKNNDIEIIKLKEKDGSVKEKIFTQGTGGAGRYGFEFGFLENEKMIFQASFYVYNSPEDYCKVEAYVYNKPEDLFEYNEEKSQALTENYCKNLCNSINEYLKEYFVNICK